MPRNISPVNDVTPAPEAIPDRSDLAKLYEHSNKRTSGRQSEDKNRIDQVNAEVRDMSFLASITLNLLVSIPYIFSFVSITAIYSIGETSGVEDALTSRIMTMALTVTALLPWVFAVRILRRHLSNYRISPFGLVVLYALFIFPVLDISLALREYAVMDSVMLAATFIMSQLYVWAGAYLLNSKKSLLSLRVLPVGAFILAIMIVAIVI